MTQYRGTTPECYSRIIRDLLDRDRRPSRAGDMREMLGVTIRSPDPRERFLSRRKFNLPFALQETFAYWMGRNPGNVHRYNSNMEQWLTDGGELPGSAYGDRMRNTAGHDQLDRAESQLANSPHTRRAVIQVHQAHEEDYQGGDVACTNHLHLFRRDGELHCHASIRSQDMFWGFVYDAQNNQAIQEMLAGRLGLDLGEYVHQMESAHVYCDFEDRAEESIDEVEEHDGPWSAHDARLPPGEHAEAMDLLDRGLERARTGGEPEGEWRELRGMSRYYADHLAVMASYERGRFHDDMHRAKEWANLVDNDGFRGWLERWLAGEQF